jgi:hypothetical protein
MRGQPALGLHSGEVLHIPTDEPAQVLHEPVDQPSKVDRVTSRPPVVVAVGVDRRSVRPHGSVRLERRGDE